jgi:hypothetical protein
MRAQAENARARTTKSWGGPGIGRRVVADLWTNAVKLASRSAEVGTRTTLGWHPDLVPAVLVVPLALGTIVVEVGCRI